MSFSDGTGNYLKDSNGNGAFDPGIDLGNWTTNTLCPGDGVNDYTNGFKAAA